MPNLLTLFRPLLTLLLICFLAACVTNADKLPDRTGLQSGPFFWKPDSDPTLSYTHRLDGLTLVGIASAGWSQDRMQAWAKGLPERLADCAIKTGPVRMRLVKEGAPDAIANSHFNTGKTGPLIIFADSIANSPHGHASSGVTRPASGGGGLYATIARRTAAGRKLKPEQTITHELGHILGLGHSDTDSSLTPMHPRGCFRCSFSDRQCERMRRHELVKPI